MTESSAQLRKPKQVNKWLLLIGAALLILFGVGLIFWIFALVDYLFQKEKVIFITASQLRLNDRETQSKKVKPRKAPQRQNNGPPLVIILGIPTILVLLLGVFCYYSMGPGSRESPSRTIPATFTPVSQNSRVPSVASQEPQSRSVVTDYGIFNIPGIGYMDGRDPQANPPLTLMNISVRTSLLSPAPLACKLPHGTRVEILDAQQDPDRDETFFKFRVKSGSCEGWVSWWFVNKDKHDPIGDQMF